MMLFSVLLTLQSSIKSTSNMKIKRPLILFIIFFYLINLIFVLHAMSLTGGTSLGYVFIFPAFWIIYLLIVLITSLIKRKVWLSSPYRLGTIFSIILCSPVLLFVLFALFQGKDYRVGSGYIPRNGKTYRIEIFVFRKNHQTSAIKIWSAKGNEVFIPDELYKKDSIWVYFNQEGDTIKKEIYRNDSLIRIIKLTKD